MPALTGICPHPPAPANGSISPLCFSLGGFAQEIPVQSPLSITKSKGSVRLECHFKDFSGDFDGTVIHWYQQKVNKAPERILYLAKTKVVDEGFQAYKYMVAKLSPQKLCALTINDVEADDTATYYCAYWEPHGSRHSEITQTNTPSASQPQTACKSPTHMPRCG